MLSKGNITISYDRVIAVYYQTPPSFLFSEGPNKDYIFRVYFHGGYVYCVVSWPTEKKIGVKCEKR